MSIANPKLVQKTRIFMKAEECAGVQAFTAGSLSLNDGTRRTFGASWTPDFARIDQNFADGTLGFQKQRASVATAQIAYSMELQSSALTTAGAIPPWELPLLSSGFQAYPLYYVVVTGAFTGPASDPALLQGLRFRTNGTTQARGNVAFSDYGENSGTRRLYFYEFDPLNALSETTPAATQTEISIVSPDLPQTGTTVQLASNLAAAPAVLCGRIYVPASSSIGQLAFETAPSGTINAGDLIAGATSGSLIQAVTQADGTSTFMRFIPLFGYPEVGEVMQVSGGGPNFIIGPAGSLSQASHVSMTMAYDEDALGHLLLGARSQWNFNAVVNEPATFAFNSQGLISSIEDLDLVGQPAFEGAESPLYQNVEILWGNDGEKFAGVTAPGQDWKSSHTRFGMSLNSGRQQRQDACAPSGILGYDIRDRQLTADLSVASLSESVFGLGAKALAGTTFPLRTVWGDTSKPFNYFRIQANRAQITNLASGDNNDERVKEHTLRLNKVYGDDEIAIAVGDVRVL